MQSKNVSRNVHGVIVTTPLFTVKVGQPTVGSVSTRGWGMRRSWIAGCRCCSRRGTQLELGEFEQIR